MPDIATQLAQARKQLLDLSARNRLLSIPQQTRSKLVRVHGGTSTEVLRVLIDERRKMGFCGDKRTGDDGGRDESLPVPDSNDDAGDSILPAPDRILQTKLAPEALQRRLLSIYHDARTGIEEQGVNTLFLALGQLRWRDSDRSDIDRFAPLVLIPVELERPSARASFRLKTTEEDPSDNLSLVEKVKEFGIVVPTFEWIDEFDLDGYLGAWKTAIAQVPQWEVLPDTIVLGFFSFAKFLMYRDLDPETWPSDSPLHTHPLVGALPHPGEMPAEMDYDCEVCCRPMVIVFTGDEVYARGLAD